MALSVTVSLDRHDDETQRFIRCQVVEDSLLIVYEGGLVALSNDGTMRWQTSGKWMDLRIKNFEDDIVRLEGVHELDDRDDEFAVRLTTGQLVDL